MENDNLREKLLSLEVYVRRENLRFSGLVEDQNESPGGCRKKVCDFFKNKLKIANAEKIEFQRCHRVGIRKDNKHRDIIVRFVRYGDRQTVWRQKTKLKGSQVVIKEDLPQEIETRKARLFPIYKAAIKQGMKALLVADKLFIENKRYMVDSLDTLPVSLQPKNLCHKQGNNMILFYGRDSIMSNFYSCNFTLDGKQYSSSEKYYQYQRACQAGNMDIAEKIMDTDDPAEQHHLGNRLKMDNIQWRNTAGKEIMETALMAKFGQNLKLKDAFLNTGNNMIVECNKYDKFWSNGLSLHDPNGLDRKSWKGENNLGNLLIFVRENLK